MRNREIEDERCGVLGEVGRAGNALVILITLPLHFQNAADGSAAERVASRPT